MNMSSDEFPGGVRLTSSTDRNTGENLEQSLDFLNEGDEQGMILFDPDSHVLTIVGNHNPGIQVADKEGHIIYQLQATPQDVVLACANAIFQNRKKDTIETEVQFYDENDVGPTKTNGVQMNLQPENVAVILKQLLSSDADRVRGDAFNTSSDAQNEPMQSVFKGFTEQYIYTATEDITEEVSRGALFLSKLGIVELPQRRVVNDQKLDVLIDRVANSNDLLQIRLAVLQFYWSLQGEQYYWAFKRANQFIHPNDSTGSKIEMTVRQEHFETYITQFLDGRENPIWIMRLHNKVEGVDQLTIEADGNVSIDGEDANGEGGHLYSVVTVYNSYSFQDVAERLSDIVAEHKGYVFDTKEIPNAKPEDANEEWEPEVGNLLFCTLRRVTKLKSNEKKGKKSTPLRAPDTVEIHVTFVNETYDLGSDGEYQWDRGSNVIIKGDPHKGNISVVNVQELSVGEVEGNLDCVAVPKLTYKNKAIAGEIRINGENPRE